MNKYELTENTKEINGITLHQIRALISFADINEGDLGGWIEKEENLSKLDDARVSENACVFGNARVKNNTDYTTIQGFGREQRVTTFLDARTEKSVHGVAVSMEQLKNLEQQLRKHTKIQSMQKSI